MLGSNTKIASFMLHLTYPYGRRCHLILLLIWLITFSLVLIWYTLWF